MAALEPGWPGADPARTAWVVLILMSLCSFAAIETGLVAALAAVIVVAVAAAKARLIMLSFMEIKSVARNWRVMYTSWILAAAAILLIGDLAAMVKA